MILLSWLACGAGPAVCAYPDDAASPAWADANGDGHVDIDDGVRIVRRSLSGGAPVACEGQGDLLGSGDVAFEAAATVWSALFLGTVATLPERTCGTRLEAGPPPSCTPVELAIEAPKSATGSFTADVVLRTDLGPDAWSFGVAADGCRISDVGRGETASASTFDDPPGIVEAGLFDARLVVGGAVSAVVPSWKDPVTLDAAAGVSLLKLRIEPTASACGTCTLSLVSDLQGPGQPVAVVVGRDGWSFPPTTRDAGVRLCP
jgi:hypothetical protein